ncbi:MarR family transcriptional regulator [Pseudonocardia spinosispora]|uniref:MarR family winged helix-turn-helix transcriptional regulator n=1 Tax=Pseudonocardia spinosispora TaxID=103441 RepID=UPI000A06B016
MQIFIGTAGISHNTVFLISQIGSQVATRFAQGLEPLGIRPAHFDVLVQISRSEGQSQQRLAELVGVHRNVMVGLIDDLERRELVERRSHPEDRRAHAIHLAGAAFELLSRAELVAEECEASLFAGIDPAEHDHLREVLQRIARHVGLTPSLQHVHA